MISKRGWHDFASKVDLTRLDRRRCANTAFKQARKGSQALLGSSCRSVNEPAPTSLAAFILRHPIPKCMNAKPDLHFPAASAAHRLKSADPRCFVMAVLEVHFNDERSGFQFLGSGAHHTSRTGGSHCHHGGNPAVGDGDSATAPLAREPSDQ